eukprot:3365373-Lingulodinium_polyedra.AAC.1
MQTVIGIGCGTHGVGGPAARWPGPLPAASSTDDPRVDVGVAQRIPWLGSPREVAPVVDECDPQEFADCLE